jgi:hypothetical protein
MAITKQISIRLDETVLAEVDAEALRLGVSRNLVISRRVEKLPPLYSVDRESGVISIVPENGESRKKIADDLAGVVGENPACAPMGKREYGDYFPVIDTTPVEDKGKVLDELRGLVAGIKNNVMITPTMGEDGNFVEICPVCGGRGIIDGCPECGVIQESFIAGAKPCSLCGEEMVAAKGKWACGDQSCGIYGREQGRVE